MKKLVLGIAVAALAPSAFAYDTYNARALGQAGTGVVAGNYGSATINPAMASVLTESDDFGTRLNVGLEASDEDEFIDGIETAQDEIDALQAKINSGSAVPGDQDAALAAIQDLQGRVVRLQTGTDFQIAIPSDYIGAALFVKSNLYSGLDFVYDSADETNIIFDAENLDSSVRASGYGVTEAGIALSHQYKDLGLGDFIIGLSPKYQRIDLINRTQSISNFEVNDIRDDMVEESGFNADLGALYLFGNDRQYRAGATVRNLVPVSVTGANGEEFEMDPQVSFGLGYDNGLASASLEADATNSPEYGNVESTQFVRLGFELDAWEWAQLRAGVRHDLNGNQEDVMTAGLGLSPMGVINIDVAGLYGKNNTYGAAVQIGARF